MSPGLAMTAPAGLVMSAVVWFAVHPVAPFVGAHVVFGGVQDGAVVALAVEVGAAPAGQIPVDVFVGGVALEAGEVFGDAEAAAPAAVAFLERLVGAGDALGADGGDGGGPHGLEDDLAGGHEVDALVEGFPEGAELAGALLLDEEGDGLVDLGLSHVALVAIFDQPGGSP